MENIKDVRLAMMVGASSALTYIKKKPSADSEEVMRHVIENVRAKGDAKLAGIAAASHAIKFKERKPSATEKEVMQDIANRSSEILTSIQPEI